MCLLLPSPILLYISSLPLFTCSIHFPLSPPLWFSLHSSLTFSLISFPLPHSLSLSCIPPSNTPANFISHSLPQYIPCHTSSPLLISHQPALVDLAHTHTYSAAAATATAAALLLLLVVVVVAERFTVAISRSSAGSWSHSVMEWTGNDVTPVCDFNGQVCFVTAAKRLWKAKCHDCGLVTCFPTTVDNYCSVCFRTARLQQHGWICCGRPCWEVYQQHRQLQREALSAGQVAGHGSGGTTPTPSPFMTTATQQPVPLPPPPPAPYKVGPVPPPPPPQQPPQQQLQQQQSPPMDMDTDTLGAFIKEAIESSKIPHLHSMNSLKLENC